MLYLATISFSGQISVAKGKVIDINDDALAEDLLKAGYIVPFEATDKKEEAPEKPKTKRKGKKDED